MNRLLYVLLLLLMCSSSANAWWVVKASWWTDNEQQNSREYEGKGTTKAVALRKAQLACADGRPKETVGLCGNTPLRTNFSEFKDPPGGTYLKSCRDCTLLEGDVISCSQCKPKIETRILDLKACTSRDIIENCNGDLHCGACPRPPEPKCEGDARITNQMRKAGCDAVCLASGWKVSCPKKGEKPH